MSKNTTPSINLRKLQKTVTVVKKSSVLFFDIFCKIPPFFKHIFLQYCTMWGLVSYSVSPLAAVRRSMTLTTSLVCVR
jgi:hypothetical protein